LYSRGLDVGGGCVNCGGGKLGDGIGGWTLECDECPGLF
jgi:hypothetical protein